ncbi:Uncharacterised protein [Mycolicibacterium aurum]|uniref:Resolvase HTH domain-containing protein n=1 Tax=Mycolicibacterium aurum TaxID=1791 RepID=A0A3S4S0S2_MYCAU|nr:helix-turn-helix domain-containing protein [Mycolicibacterium aurum]VEG57136.1 Uncharacterised protein [Mycolicibacterium aurum]
MSVTIDYDARRGIVYECGCGFGGAMPSLYLDAAVIEAHVRICDRKPKRTADPPKRGSKLDERQVREIRRRHANGETQKDIARRFGVSGPTISAIVQRRTWADVH